MTDETTALLIRARGFIERGWCRETFARDANGKGVLPSEKTAVAWCASGALIAAGVPFDFSGYPERYFSHPAVHRLQSAMSEDIPLFNNAQKTVEPVLAAFDRAIAVGRAQG